MWENIKTFEQYFDARDRLERTFWKKSDALNDKFDELMAEANDEKETKCPT